MRQRGFTLIEILIALTILAIVLVLVGPRAAQYIDSVEFRSRSDEIARDIARLRLRALIDQKAYAAGPLAGEDDLTGAAFALGGASADLDLPPGWSIAGGPILFLPTGACAGGEITLTGPRGRLSRYRFEPPRCAPVRVENSPS